MPSLLLRRIVKLSQQSVETTAADAVAVAAHIVAVDVDVAFTIHGEGGKVGGIGGEHQIIDGRIIGDDGKSSCVAHLVGGDLLCKTL